MHNAMASANDKDLDFYGAKLFSPNISSSLFNNNKNNNGYEGKIKREYENDLCKIDHREQEGREKQGRIISGHRRGGANVTRTDGRTFRRVLQAAVSLVRIARENAKIDSNSWGKSGNSSSGEEIETRKRGSQHF